MGRRGRSEVKGADAIPTHSPTKKRRCAIAPDGERWARAEADGLNLSEVALSAQRLMPAGARPRVMQLARSKALHLACGHCLAPVGSLTMQLLVAAGHGRTEVLKAARAGKSPSLFPRVPGCGEWPSVATKATAKSSAGNNVPFVECTQGCGELYCTAECRDDAWHQGHRMLCVGRCRDETDPLFQFKMLALTHCETFLLAAQIICLHLCSASSTQLATVFEQLIAGGTGEAEGATRRGWADVADYAEVLDAFRASCEAAGQAAGTGKEHWIPSEQEGEEGTDEDEDDEEQQYIPEHFGDACLGMSVFQRRKLVRQAHQLLLQALADAPAEESQEHGGGAAKEKNKGENSRAGGRGGGGRAGGGGADGGGGACGELGRWLTLEIFDQVWSCRSPKP